jgi:hypothetical protein
MEMPPAMVEVAVEVETITPNCPLPTSIEEAWMVVLEAKPPVKVEVAVEVEVITPVVNLPIDDEEKKESTNLPRVLKNEVEVALVRVARTKVESVAEEVAVITPAVNCPMEEEARKESMKRPLEEKKEVEVPFTKVMPPFERTEKAVVVPPLVGSVTTEKRV